MLKLGDLVKRLSGKRPELTMPQGGGMPGAGASPFPGVTSVPFQWAGGGGGMGGGANNPFGALGGAAMGPQGLGGGNLAEILGRLRGGGAPAPQGPMPGAMPQNPLFGGGMRPPMFGGPQLPLGMGPQGGFGAPQLPPAPQMGPMGGPLGQMGVPSFNPQQLPGGNMIQLMNMNRRGPFNAF